MKLYGFAGEDSKEIFSNTYKIYMYFEYVQNDLSKICKRRRDFFTAKKPTIGSSRLNLNYQYFEETELLAIANNLIDALEFMQSYGISHGDIRTDTCFISKEGNVKVINRRLVCDERSNFEVARDGNHGVFLTPIAFDTLKKKGSEEPIQDRYKADVFSLGMVLLECATLKRSYQCYDWNNYTVNLNVLSQRLLEVKDRYSDVFYEIIREMVRFDEEKRPDFAILKTYMNHDGAISTIRGGNQLSNFNEISVIIYICLLLLNLDGE